ncbi:MAG: AIPR family protein [Clostridiales bacterium]|nr:AIPR family protein [Clostridiales bacterium]
MDPITNKFLDEFCKSYEIGEMNTEDAFEHFCNYCCVDKENGIVDVKLEEMSTGKAVPGIDGIAIIVNHKIVTSISEIEFQIQNSRILDVNFVFIQAKTSPSFDNSLMLNFFEFTKSFFSEDCSELSTPEIQNFFEMKEYIYDNAEYMTESNPRLSMYYVTTGKWVNDKTLVRVIERNEKELQNLNIFSAVKFNPCGAKEIQSLYRATKNTLSTKFKFEKHILMFGDEDSDSMGYSGVIPFKEYKKIIIGEGDSLRPVFDDNIRDFLGNRNQVNKAIMMTLQNLDVNSFCMLNNGITIIADKVQFTGSTAILTDYQIVNGCQTSHVLYDNRNLEGIDDLLIPIKVIGTKDDVTRNSITKATNSQTSIKPEQLEALSDFQKDLEIFYSTFPEDRKMYYERRTGQYRMNSIPKTRIVSIPQQIKSVSAMFLNNPHGVSGNYGSIVKAVGNKIFNVNDQKIIYYTSSIAQYKIEKLISEGVIDKKYNKSRYHAMMLFRIYVSGKRAPKFNETKMDAYCNKINAVLFDDTKCKVVFSRIIEFIAAQKEIDFDDRKTFERKETTDVLLSKTNEMKKYIDKKK